MTKVEDDVRCVRCGLRTPENVEHREVPGLEACVAIYLELGRTSDGTVVIRKVGLLDSSNA